MNRLDRLTTILIQLQSKKIVKAAEIADRFEISLRTVYRDVKSLMEAGVPIGSEAGTGYFIVDGFHLPPVMFTQDEASAMIMAGKLVEQLTDKSVQVAFNDALMKIKSVLNEGQKDHIQILHDHIEVFKPQKNPSVQSSHFLTELQRATATKKVITIEYENNQNEITCRSVEPIGLLYYSASWHLIAWCRLRHSFRDFRCDRIKQLKQSDETFKPRNISTIKEYFNSLQHANVDMELAVVLFHKKEAQYIKNSRHYFGFVEEEELEGQVRMKFLTADLDMMARWLLSYGSGIEIEESDRLKSIIQGLIVELNHHYLPIQNHSFLT